MRRYMIWSVAFVSAGLASLPARAQDLPIGVAVAMSGTYAFAGVPSREGMDVAFDQLKSGALGNRLKVQFQDTAGERTQGITLANQFATRDKVLLMIGPTSSAEAVAVAPVANSLSMPMLTATALSEEITKAGKWSFKTPGSPADLIGAICNYAADIMKKKKIVLVFGRDNEGMVSHKNAAKAVFEKKGAKILAEESVLGSDTEFLALVTKIIDLDPDAVFFTTAGEQTANFVVQLRQGGLDPSVAILGSPNLASDRFVAVGGKAVEGATFASDYFHGSTTPENQRFVADYQAKFKRLPDNGAALGYTALQIAARAFADAGPNPTRDSVREALGRIKEMPVVLGNGRFSYDANRNPSYGAVVLRVKSGQFTAAP